MVNIKRSMRLLLLGVFLTSHANAAEYRVGDTVAPYEITDNHGEKHLLGRDMEVIILSFDMEKSKEIHSWLAQKDEDFLAKNRTQYVADITKMPAIITKMFAGPKMAKYKFKILLANDETFSPRFPKSGTKITALVLDGSGKITHVLFLNNMNEVNGLISR